MSKAVQRSEKITDAPVIGKMDPLEVAGILEKLGDQKSAADIRLQVSKTGKAGMLSDMFPWGKPKPWQHTAHQIGYMAPANPGSGPSPIQPVGTIPADPALKNKRINVHLQRLRVFDYPGSGMHQVMLTVKAEHQSPKATETACFNQTYRIEEGQTAGIIGYPIFLGLAVGTTGVGFHAETINVSNDADASLQRFLESAPFKSALNLVTTVQPVLKPFSEIAVGIADMVLKRNEGVKVEEIYLGLDFQPTTMGARLAVGDYIVVQVPDEGTISWSDWWFDPNIGGIVRKGNGGSAIPFNYFVFSVTLHED